MKFLAILVCRLAAFAGRLLGRGSSMPGKLALKICPDIIARLRLPETIVAVTGSNGKTSTVELLVRILEADGKKVCWNREGSNQIEGVATMLLVHSTLRGRVRRDAVVLESDEQYARLTFRYLRPTHFVILNILRDQLTRNGHPEYVFGKIREAVLPGMTLILNADDPLVSMYAREPGVSKTVWFGFGREACRGENRIYGDGVFCPVCGAVMDWPCKSLEGFGHYRCAFCGFARAECDYELSAFDRETGEIEINSDPETRMRLGINTAYHAWNMLAAFAAASELGVPAAAVKRALSSYFLKNGRFRVWDLGGARVTLLTSKHENSVSYDCSLEYAARRGGDVLVIVDAISRKYFTGETSWLWDIDFDLLAGERVGHIWLAGKYVYDLAHRLSFSSVPAEKIDLLESLDEIPGLIERTTGDLFVITCFADRDKLISRLPGGARETEGEI